MTIARMPVLYEDQRGATNSFELHAFVLAIAADLSGGVLTRASLARATYAVPTKGVDKLLSKLEHDLDALCATGNATVAVFDSDVIRRHVNVPAHSDLDAVRAAIRGRCPAPLGQDPEKLGLGFIEPNLEDFCSSSSTAAWFTTSSMSPSARASAPMRRETRSSGSPRWMRSARSAMPSVPGTPDSWSSAT